MFNIEAFDIKLDTNYIGREFIYADEIDSTNTFLLDKRNNIKTNGTVLLAEKQTAGKGRKDKTWLSAKGQNLTFSILLNNKSLFKQKVSLINFVASLSVAISIENLYQVKTELKWPNDVLISGKKVAGILFESLSEGNKIERLVTGIGINVNQSNFQGDFAIPPTSIKLEFGEAVERERFLAEILNVFEEHLDALETKPDEILEDWKSRCRMIGEKISVSQNDKTIYGIFDDLDENGFLILKTERKTEKIHFGDVSVR